MEINNELIDATLSWIRNHPESWDQGIWVNEYGTHACFGGWALLLSGYRMAVGPCITCQDSNCLGWRGLVDIDGDKILGTKRAEANKILGFTRGQGEHIYYAPNDLGSLESRVANVREGRIL